MATPKFSISCAFFVRSSFPNGVSAANCVISPNIDAALASFPTSVENATLVCSASEPSLTMAPMPAAAIVYGFVRNSIPHGHQ